MAPKELIFFDDYREKFLKNPDAFTEKDRKKRDKMLGFTVPDGTTQLLTTFVLPIALETIKKWWSKKASQKLSSDQLNTMRSEAYNNAITLGVDKEKAELMADALVGKIVRLSEVK
jgi:ABC-type transport system involved in cytochrome bd biosynthesis fused ATPase/permease subunit